MSRVLSTKAQCLRFDFQSVDSYSWLLLKVKSMPLKTLILLKHF